MEFGSYISNRLIMSTILLLLVTSQKCIGT